MESPRQEYWSRLALFPPGDLPHLGTEPALAGGLLTTGATWKPDAMQANPITACCAALCQASMDPQDSPVVILLRGLGDLHKRGIQAAHWHVTLTSLDSGEVSMDPEAEGLWRGVWTTLD